MRSHIFGQRKHSRARSKVQRNLRETSTRLHVQQLEDRLVMSTLPAGFTETLVTTGSNLTSPTAMEFSPTGQLFVLEQTGAAKLVRTDGTAFPAITLSVDSAGERGLLGIAFDPSYDGAGANADFVYLYYTAPTGATPRHNRISRFTVTGAGTLSPTFGSETVLRDLPPEAEDGNSNHNGGAIHFGIDGKLYVAVGDHNYDTTPQSAHVSQLTTTPFGKVLRLNPDGTNVVGNPFHTGSATDWQGSIWAMGLRNPYTFAFQPGSGKMFINDVGESNWEEINQGQAGANYGWAGSSSPLREGFLSPAPWPNYANPAMAYDHSSASGAPAGVAITGGAFYPSGGQFGNAYAGKYFFSDYGASFIRIFDPASPGSGTTPDTSTGFATGVTGAVDLKLDAAGNLYYLSRGGTGEVFRISSTQPSVVARQLFYNNSFFDNPANGAGLTNDTAIAPNKSAYLPGGGTTTFANYSTYDKGINGVMIDLSAGGNHAALSASADFTFKVSGNTASSSPSTWTTLSGANLPSINVRTGQGLAGSDRIELVWADLTIVDTWLEIIVKNTTNTGLSAQDVFYFGNMPGDTNDDPTGDFKNIDATDQFNIKMAATNANNTGLYFGNTLSGAISNLWDINRDGDVNASDQYAAKIHSVSPFGGLAMINIPIGGPFAPVAGGSDASVALNSALSHQTDATTKNEGTWLANSLIDPKSDNADRAQIFERIGALSGAERQSVPWFMAENDEPTEQPAIEDEFLNFLTVTVN